MFVVKIKDKTRGLVIIPPPPSPRGSLDFGFVTIKFAKPSLRLCSIETIPPLWQSIYYSSLYTLLATTDSPSVPLKFMCSSPQNGSSNPLPIPSPGDN